MARAHHADAGGPAEVNEAKHAIRERVWAALKENGHARFPGARGRIPNVTGAEAAAELLRGTDEWRAARTIKSNPDAAQWPVRRRALEDGKTVYMAVPRLAGANPFFLLDPERITESPRKASSIKGATAAGVTVGVDLLVTADRVVRCSRGAGGPRAPGRLRWDELTEDKIAAIPLLGRLRPA